MEGVVADVIVQSFTLQMGARDIEVWGKLGKSDQKYGVDVVVRAVVPQQVV